MTYKRIKAGDIKAGDLYITYINKVMHKSMVNEVTHGALDNHVKIYMDNYTASMTFCPLEKILVQR